MIDITVNTDSIDLVDVEPVFPIGGIPLSLDILDVNAVAITLPGSPSLLGDSEIEVEI